MNTYRRLLDKYDKLLHTQGQSLEREAQRLAIVKEMDRIWQKEWEQQIFQYANLLYQRRL